MTRRLLVLMTTGAMLVGGSAASAAGAQEPPAPDTTPPTITIVPLSELIHLSQGVSAETSFSCADEPGGSGVATCSGPAEYDTAAIGEHTLTVTATDVAGNEASSSLTYDVGPPMPPVCGTVTRSTTARSCGAPCSAYGQVGEPGSCVDPPLPCPDGQAAASGCSFEVPISCGRAVTKRCTPRLPSPEPSPAPSPSPSPSLSLSLRVPATCVRGGATVTVGATAKNAALGKVSLRLDGHALRTLTRASTRVTIRSAKLKRPGKHTLTVTGSTAAGLKAAPVTRTVTVCAHRR